MRVLVLTNCYPNEHKVYAGMFVRRHVEFHREMGVEVTVLAPGDSRQGGWRSAWKYLWLFLRVWKVLLFGQFDLVHAHWPFPAGLYALFFSRLRRKPFVLTSHGAFVDNLDQYPRLLRWLVRLVLRRADVLIVVGREHRERVVALSGRSAVQMKLLDMGVWLPPAVPSRVEARQLLGLPAGEPLLLFVGNLIPRKGVDILLQAAARLAQNNIPFHLLIGGQGPERPALEAWAAALGLAGRVTFTGPIPHQQVYTWFAAADVVVVPSRREPFGIVPLEAMGCGAAVVAADTGGLAENIRDGENGLLFSVEDEAALARQLQQLLADEALRGRLAQAGRRTAASFDMRGRAAAVKEIYERVLAGEAAGVARRCDGEGETSLDPG